jgi:peptide chain release factor subunit 1
MSETVTWERLRELAGFRSERGWAISFYVGLDPSLAPTAADVEKRVNALVAEGEKWESAARDGLSHDQRRGLRDDLDRIRRWFDEEFVRDGVRGVALFAAGRDGMWAPLPVGDPVKDGIAIARRFQLAPLVPLVGKADGALVAAVGRERGEVYRLRDGRLEEVADLTEEQPGQHDQGGWSQANYRRHIDALVADHLRGVAATLNRSVRRAHGAPVVVVCGEETRSEFAELLAQETREVLAGWTTTEAHAGPSELLAAALPVVERWRVMQEAAALERWRDEAGRAGRAAVGWEQTLEAASDGRVELLLFQTGVAREAWQCPECGRGSTSDGGCPLDGTPMERRENGLDVAVHQTLAHGGTARAVEHNRDLEPAEGIGALLRF